MGPRRRERPAVKWNRVKKYMHERVADRWGGTELARKECLDRGGYSSAMVVPWSGVSEGNEVLETIDR